MQTRLLIARHGNTFNKDEVVRRVGSTDLPLTEEGLLQGARLGLYLKTHNLIPDAIFTSERLRTRQTAMEAQTIMQTNCPLQILSLFNEIDYGPDENQPEERVLTRIGRDALEAWEASAIAPPDWQVDPERIINGWKDFAQKISETYMGKTVLVVTSNGIARFAPWLTGDFEAFSREFGIKVATGALCIFQHQPPLSLWQCLAWNLKP